VKGKRVAIIMRYIYIHVCVYVCVCTYLFCVLSHKYRGVLMLHWIMSLFDEKGKHLEVIC
jgi:hypothetical protein